MDIDHSVKPTDKKSEAALAPTLEELKSRLSKYPDLKMSEGFAYPGLIIGDTHDDPTDLNGLYELVKADVFVGMNVYLECFFSDCNVSAFKSSSDIEEYLKKRNFRWNDMQSIILYLLLEKAEKKSTYIYGFDSKMPDEIKPDGTKPKSKGLNFMSWRMGQDCALAHSKVILQTKRPYVVFVGSAHKLLAKRLGLPIHKLKTAYVTLTNSR